MKYRTDVFMKQRAVPAVMTMNVLTAIPAQITSVSGAPARHLIIPILAVIMTSAQHRIPVQLVNARAVLLWIAMTAGVAVMIPAILHLVVCMIWSFANA
jgi:hypothetical protein